jgi:2-polyprenyl-3-methyl-5-hydroxy-6-metoxy-1,4-benzoquinol methylase
MSLLIDEETMAAAGAFTEQTFGNLLAAAELLTTYLGVKLGLYAALAAPQTPGELAAACGIDTRYAQEWLEQQAVSGVVDVDDPAADAAERRYVLPAAHALALTGEGSPVYAAPMALLLGGAGAVMPALVEAFRTGRGISFGEYGDDVRLGQGGFNQPGFQQQLVDEWIPAMPAVSAALGRPSPRLLDVGCGVGWSTIALAEGFPAATIDGIDSDEASIADARAHAATSTAAQRIRFAVFDAAAPVAGPYDAAFVFEALHDMAHPVEALASIRAALAPGGVTVVMDEAAEEAFAPNGPPLERAFYAFSVLHCLPVGRSQPGSASTGTVMRPSTLRRYAAAAGYADVGIADIEHPMFRFYVLTP